MVGTLSKATGLHSCREERKQQVAEGAAPAS